MSQKKKLTLDDLKVKSFVVSDPKGGAVDIEIINDKTVIISICASACGCTIGCSYLWNC
ncbi:MAG: pinensin family lanthipeptide [Acidobacteriota bacterium]|nr:pinensin family lanthipeptide [Acidobacteriota bacterium]